MSCPNIPCCAPYKGGYEEIQAYFISKEIPFHIVPGKIEGSRLRSKVAVRGSSQKPLIGLFKPGTHEVYEIPCCILHHNKINEAIQKIKKWIVTHKIEPYSEKTHSGLLSYIQCVVERQSSKVQLSFVLKARSKEFEKALLELIDPSIHSLWINVNPGKSNTIFGAEWNLIYGEKWLKEEIAGVPVCYLPGSFGQANLELFEKLIESIHKQLPAEKRVGEFYAGVGVIGLRLSSKSSQVILSEVNPESKVCFEEMKRYLSKEILDKVTYRLAKTEEVLDILEEVEVAIVDPPRKGLDRSFIAALEKSKVEILIYVSCGFPALIRDLELLKEWKVIKAEGYPFFPGTPHLEILCFLERKLN